MDRRIELMPLASIREADSNPKDHDVGAIIASFTRFGFGEAPMLDERTQRLVAGHGRIEALRQLQKDAKAAPSGVNVDSDDWLVPVQRGWASADDAEAKGYLLASNRTTELGGWDKAQLDAMLLDLSKDGGVDALLGTGFGGADLDRLLRAEASADDVVEPAVEPWVKPGDQFSLGDHRLMCGSSVDGHDVSALMGGAVAAVCITDPPYSVEYDRSQAERGGNAAAHAAYREADINPTTILGFLSHVRSDVLVMSYPLDRHLFALADALRRFGFEPRKELVWVKDTFSFWPGAQYQQRHEPILVCAKTGRPTNSHVPANVSTVFEIPRPRSHAIHPTQKPVDLWTSLITFHSTRGDIVFEPFSGSGTTIIACEETHRRCHAMEISPAYVQAAIERWEKFTGRKAEKL